MKTAKQIVDIIEHYLAVVEEVHEAMECTCDSYEYRHAEEVKIASIKSILRLIKKD